MIRQSLITLSLLVPLCAGAYEPARTPIQAPVPAPAPSQTPSQTPSPTPVPAESAATPTPTAPASAAVSAAAAPVTAAPAAAATATGASASALPAMYFLSSVAQDELFTALKADPNFAALDKELVGSPLTLIVTHTVRPTPGGQAAGLLTAVLAGSTLGLIPLVSSERLVVKYEVRLNGRSVASHSFERTATRAQNMWSGAAAGGGLGKAGLEWVKSTAAEAATKIAKDPAILAVRQEMDFYFPSKPEALRK